MFNSFSQAEVDFVSAGGNLWYVDKEAEDGWNVVRWSQGQGHRVVVPAAPSEQCAQRHLLALVRPTSSRTRTAIHHEIVRLNDEMHRNFPALL